jgi:hypothetical protein
VGQCFDRGAVGPGDGVVTDRQQRPKPFDVVLGDGR